MDFSTSRKGYANLWDDAKILPVDEAKLERICQEKIFPNMPTYMKVEKAIGVPWYWVAATNERESSGDFHTHLHNGDPLSARTYHRPPGRPPNGNPPFTWFDSAIDALTIQPHSLKDVKVWSIERMLYEWERYNGEGYIRRNENAPYVWAWTSEQEYGKYVADGVYDKNAWDSQVGTAVILQAVLKLDPSIKPVREGKAPPDVVDEHTKREQKARTTGAVVAGTSTGSKAVTHQVGMSDWVHNLEWFGIGIGFVLFVACAILVTRKENFLKLKWG